MVKSVKKDIVITASQLEPLLNTYVEQKIGLLESRLNLLSEEKHYLLEELKDLTNHVYRLELKIVELEQGIICTKK